MSKNVKSVVEISVESAIAELKAALDNVTKLHDATNDALKAVAGSILGGIGAFHKQERKLNAYVEQALKAVKKNAVCGRYYRKIEDFILHESGVSVDEYGFVMADTGALAKAQEAVKTASIITYVSEETKAAKTAKANDRTLAKQAFVDASAKERVLAFLKSGIDDAEKRKAKEDKKDLDKRNGAEVDKTTEEIKIFERLIEFLSKQQ